MVLADLPAKVIVVGSGAIGMEFSYRLATPTAWT